MEPQTESKTSSFQILIWVVLAIIVIGGGWYYFSNSKTAPVAETGPLKIGVVVPLTGDAAIYGEPMRNTFQLAADDINASGGINGRQVKLILEDGKCQSPAAVSATQKLVSVDKVQAIIGGFCSGETIPSVPIAAAAKVLMLSEGASSPALTGISPYFFRVYPSDAAQGLVLAQAASKKGWKKVAFIQEQTDYATGIYKAFDQNFTVVDGKTTNDSFPSTTSDFRSVLTKIKSQNPDALFIDTQNPQPADRILTQLKEMNWKPKLIVNDIIAGDPGTLKKNANTEGALTAEFLPDGADPDFVGFIAKYKNKYGAELPYQNYMAVGYDAINVLFDGIKAVGYDGQKLAEWSRTIKDWKGASGSITILPSGDRASGHVLEIIQGGKTVRAQ